MERNVENFNGKDPKDGTIVQKESVRYRIDLYVVLSLRELFPLLNLIQQ